MKRLLVLTLVAILSVTTGSGCWHWFNRGAPCAQCPPMGGAPCADTHLSAPGMGVPADGYLPAPG